MKKLMFLFLFVLLLVSSAFAQTDRWIIDQDDGDIRMRNQLDPDPSQTYRGTIDEDGSVRMRNYDGNTLRGNIDEDGYGTLRDEDFNTYRVKPW